MPQKSFKIEKQFQTIQIEAAKIRGLGGNETSILSIPLDFELKLIDRGLAKFPFYLLGIEGRLGASGLKNKIVATVKLDSRKVTMNTPYSLDIEFHLTHAQLSKMESCRTDNACLTLDLNLFVATCDIIPLSDGNHTISHHLIDGFESVKIDEFILELPQSQWVSNVLPGMGYNASSIIEIPALSEIIKTSQASSLLELNKAAEYFAKGDYDKVVSHCRSALEPLRKEIKSAKEGIESNSERKWLMAISDVSAEWVEKMLSETHRITNKVHHEPSYGHFTKYNAQAIYLVTVSILSYTGNFTRE